MRFEAETGYKVDFHMIGALRVALSSRALSSIRSDAAVAHDAGVVVEDVSRDDIARLAPPITFDEVVGGTFVLREGYITSTRDAAIGMARAAAKEGALVRTHVEVRRLRPRDDDGYDIETSQGIVHAKKVVLAANAGGWSLTQQMGLLYPSYPVLHECAVYSLSKDVMYGMPTVRLGERDLYIRYEAAGLMIGGVGRYADGLSPAASPGDFFLAKVMVDPVELKDARERARPFVPGVDGALCFRQQRGLAMVAPDLEPVACEFIPNLYVVSADLRGVQAGPALGRLAAELAALGKSELDHPMFDPKRFRDLTDASQMRQAAVAGIRPKAAA